MTYRLQYSASEHQSLLASALESWSREDKDLRLISKEGHVIYTSCRMFALSSPALAPLLSPWGQAAHLSSTPSPTISLPFASPVISALVSLLSVGTAQIDSTLRTEAESAAALLGLSEFSLKSLPALKPTLKGAPLSIQPVSVKSEAQARESRPQTEAACDLCPKIFSSKKHLKRHQDMKHPAEMNLRKPLLNKGRLENVPSEVGDVFKCQVCDKNFTSEEKLERHGKEHLKGGAVLPFPCEKCDKSFITRKRLKKHMRSHMDLTHQCDVCEKSFQNAGILSLHKNIHLDQKPFKCEVCDKDFSQKGNLKTHMMKHHGQELSDSIVISGEPIIEETVSQNGDL